MPTNATLKFTLNSSTGLGCLGGAVGSFIAAPGQTQEEGYEDRVEERGGRGNMEIGDGYGKSCALLVHACSFVCPRRRLLCILFQWAFVG
jgi:hypothetical protein